MKTVRRRIARLATVWALLQIVGLAAPLGLLAAPHAVEELCTCPGDEHGATCPMHHGSDADSKGTSDEAQRRLQNACAPADVALLALAGGTGVLPPTATYIPAARFSGGVALIADERTSRAQTPDSPPPRF